MRPAFCKRYFHRAGAWLALGWVLGAAAQQPGLGLRMSPQLIEKPTPESELEAPAFVSGERISGQTDVSLSVDGQAQLRRGPTVVRAARIDLEEGSQNLKASGPVRLSRSGHVFTGDELMLRIDSFEGYFSKPQFRFLSGGQGRAERFEFLGDQRMSAVSASYTTCERDNEASWRPAWEFTADRLDFDFDAEVGQAQHMRLRFYDTTILAWPGTVSFPLSDKRKSGLLPPTYALDTTGGLTLSAPYYFNIAPNYDATLTPTLMSKRGLDLGSELRYLERSDRGSLRLNLMPQDRINQRERWSYSLQHTGRWSEGLPGALNYNLNLNRVSDDDYWRDFPRQSKALTQRLLPADLGLSWSQGPFQASLRALQWQTLQDPLSPIVPPYDRLPQLVLRHGSSTLSPLGPLETSLETDFTRFSALRSLTSQTNADRFYARGQLSSPWVWPAGYITPKLQIHATQYSFAENWRGTNAASRVLPTFSLDTGLVFERQAQWFGRGFIQTLEPRAFYVHTPFRDQSRLPNYDSAENSFSFATLFTENNFVGNDRIADANLLTLGLSSRFLVPETGAETLRLGMAQRIRFADQLVTLDGSAPPVNAERISDLMLGATVNASQAWALDLVTQYNPKRGESQRSSISSRYHPSPYRVLSAAYRVQRPVTTGDTGSQQFDVGWQWPVNDLWGDKGQDLGPGRGQGGQRWYSVGRLNYSATDGRLVDGVLGLEYDGCCWIARAVLQRSFSGLARANTQIMLQLELVGFSRIGNNPLGTLKNNIARYQFLRDQVSPPSRYANYD